MLLCDVSHHFLIMLFVQIIQKRGETTTWTNQVSCYNVYKFVRSFSDLTSALHCIPQDLVLIFENCKLYCIYIYCCRRLQPFHSETSIVNLSSCTTAFFWYEFEPNSDLFYIITVFHQQTCGTCGHVYLILSLPNSSFTAVDISMAFLLQ